MRFTTSNIVNGKNSVTTSKITRWLRRIELVSIIIFLTATEQ